MQNASSATPNTNATATAAEQKAGFFSGFKLIPTAVTAVAAICITAAGMYFFGSGSETEASE